MVSLAKSFSNSFVILIVFVIFSFGSTTFASSPKVGEVSAKVGEANEVEVVALLTWKGSLDNHSQFLLSSWVESNHHCNDWIGIGCNKASRLTHLNLSNYGLSGTLFNLNFSSFPYLVSLDLFNNLLYGNIPSNIGSLWRLTYLGLSVNHLSGIIPSEICQLTNLKILYIGRNQISGSIPREVGLLRSLTKLSLSFNNLTNSIPESITNLTNLTILYLHVNQLSGSIPQEIGILSSLVELNLSENNLTGSIPPSIGNLAHLTLLYLHKNQLSGSIPQEVGMLRSLITLDLDVNNLTGTIPTSIGNLANLTLLYLFENQLFGSIPQEVGMLNSLVELELYANNLTGSIPASIGNLANLTKLSLYKNQLSGSIPTSFNKLTHLQNLHLSDNMLIGPLPDSICLGGLLENFTAFNNKFTGPIPKSLKNCTSLYRVRLERNQITANMTEVFGVYPNLDYIDLSYNNFYGALSKQWGLCHNLTSLKISNNNISGGIPPELGEATQLQLLHLSSNHLVGEVPKDIVKLQLLFDLSLSNNKLSGKIPVELASLSKLQDLNLAANDLSGLIPVKLGECTNLQKLNLSNNRLVGDIPFQIGNLHFLQDLDLSLNSLGGEIPQQIGELQSLATLNLSHNGLSGSIPSTFNRMSGLVSVDISYNQLEGALPITKAFKDVLFEAYKDNNGLCGNKTNLKPCSHEEKRKGKWFKMVVVSVVVSILGILLLLVVGILFMLRKRVRNNMIDEPRQANNENLFVIWSFDGRMVYDNIIEATEDFSLTYCIGTGGYGIVYKAELPNGQVVAVKKLHSSQNVEMANLKSFISEIDALTNIRHRNVIKLYGFCSHPRHSFLVYEYMEGGSLEEILKKEVTALEFEWSKRINVVKDVANGLSYMHHECSPPIIHRDISSKNVMLDSEYVAHISDFGTARLLKPDCSYSTSFAGTFGYAAPELAYKREVNERLDVYSFGVLIMEVLMGRHPGDLISFLSFSSSSSSSSSSPPPTNYRFGVLLKDVLDTRLPHPGNHVAEEVILTAKLAFSCLQTSPQCRPTMRQVSVELSKLRQPLQNSLHTITLGELLGINYSTSQ